MKTEEVIKWFHREPFECDAQTTLVRARNGVLMAKFRDARGGLVHSDIKYNKEQDYPVTGAEAKAQALEVNEKHHLGRMFKEPDAFFLDDDMTSKDWVPLVVAIPSPDKDKIDPKERDHDHIFIGSAQPGTYSILFNHSNTVFGRRDARWAYDALYGSCTLHLPIAAMQAVRIPARARKVNPMDILIRAFAKVFEDVCGMDKAGLNWQLGWAHYITNNCAVRVDAKNTFGAAATKFLNSPELYDFEQKLLAIKEAVLTMAPLDYVDQWGTFTSALHTAYNNERVDTDVVGRGSSHVVSHIVDEKLPFLIPENRSYRGSLYKVVDKNWKTVCTVDGSLYQNDNAKACLKTQEQWAKVFGNDETGSSGEDYMGLHIPYFNKLRRNWPFFVDLFERLGYPEPKPFGFSLCEENEESLAVLRDTAAAQMADPSILLEAEAEETMSILG